MKYILTLIVLVSILSGCAVMETVSGDKQDDFKNEAKAMLNEAYKHVPKKRKWSNGMVVDNWFVPPYQDGVTYPDWYYEPKTYSFANASLEKMMYVLQKDYGIVSKTDTFDSVEKIKKREFPFKFDGKVGEAIEKLSLLTGLAYTIDGDFITWSEFETDYFRVAVPPSVHSFRIGDRDKQGNSIQQQFGGYGNDTEVQQLIENDSYVESVAAKDSALDAWATMDKNLSEMIGDAKGAFVTFDRSSSVMMVRAYPKVVRQIKEYVRTLENATMTQVVFDFEFVEYTNTDGAKGSLNLDLVKNNFKVGSSPTQITASSPLTAALLDSFNPVSLGSNVLGGDWAGSSAIIEALNRTGTTSIRSRPQLTVAHNKAGQLVKGSDVSVVSSSGGGINQSGAVSSISTSILSVGTQITVTPTIMDKADRIFVQMDIKQSDVAEIGVFESGDAKLQTPRVLKNDSKLNFSAKSGETILLAANNVTKKEYRSEDAGFMSWLFGFSRASNEENSEMLILVTPRIIRPDYR